jgi:hypothetical protein
MCCVASTVSRAPRQYEISNCGAGRPRRARNGSALAALGVLMVFVLLILAGCAQVALKELTQNLATCLGEIKSSPEGQMLASRLWFGDDSDTAAKLNDSKLLTGRAKRVCATP